MEQSQGHRHIVDILFVLALFGVFTLSALVLVTIGAEVYKNTVDEMSSNFETRTAVSYLTEKVRQHDSLSSVSIGELEGTPALVLTQTIGREEHILTYLYLYDGHLNELSIREGADLLGNPLMAGQKIMPLQRLSMSMADSNLISLQFTTSGGGDRTLYVSVHSR